MKIAIAGGTGTVGRHAVDVARERGHDVVVLTRSNGVDLMTGEGLVDALAGVDVVVDTANLTSTSAKAATEFFTTVTRRLLDAEAAAGIGHHVALSIVGIDRAPYGYYAAKLAQERVVESGTVPWTILRAMQFHEFAGQMLHGLTVAGIHLAPKVRTQPVAAREVGEHLVALAEGGPAGHAPDLAGPKEERLDDMIRRLAAATGVRGPVIPVALPMRQFAAMRRGDTLPGPGATIARQTFDEWLREQAAAPEAATTG
ncbi:NAD(P)H-binding protein [Agromyces tropicus]|uniref:NAD(P)H-binding protein n=1 Tax=Agromyces tropicus TaxID=555371 RepID=A0ABN2UR90_9MICO